MFSSSNDPCTENHYKTLRGLAVLQYAKRDQVQRLEFPNHRQSRSTREYLTDLRHRGLATKSKTQVSSFASNGNGTPVWYLTSKGKHACADHYEDEAFLRASTRAPRADRLHHWVDGITEINLRFRQACALQEYVKMLTFIPEWTKYHNGNEAAGGFFLHEKLQSSPPLSCSPDFAVVLSIGGYSRVYYGEADMGTAGNLERQFAARKAKGYQELANQGICKSKHFPTLDVENEFSILTVTTTPYRRDRIAEAMKPHPGADRWLISAAEDITGEASMFFEPILRDSEGRLKPLVKKPGEQQGDASEVAA